MTREFEEITRLNKMIRELLEERPEYKWYQEVIDKELAKAGDNYINRISVLESLALELREKLHKSLEEFSNETKEFTKHLKEYADAHRKVLPPEKK